MGSLEKIKPCPVCGGEAKLRINTSFTRCILRGWEFSIYCMSCGIHLSRNDYKVEVRLSENGEIETITDDRAAAIEAWNRRS